MDYAAASWDASNSKWEPKTDEPVFHFQHIAAYKDNELAKQRKEALAKLRRRR